MFITSIQTYFASQMSSFVVSARKYRPESFDSVVGQEHITQTLINEIKTDRLAQAFLFCGPRGVGKTTCARILAKEINKGSVPDGYDYSFNMFELDAASHNSVDDIRALNEQVRIPPQTGEYKVYIIDEVHMLSQQAFNAFLKTLEEPPKYAIFILATTEKHKILPTILSRCQIFNFDRIQIPEIVKHLQQIAKDENIATEEEALHLIAEKADGAMRDALSIFDQMASFGSEGKITYIEVLENLNILDYDYYFKIVDGFVAGNISEVLVLYDEIQRKGFDGQIFLNGLANHFRDLLVAQNATSQQLLEKSKELASKYHKQALSVSASFIVNAINLLGEADINYKASRNHRLHIELCLIKLASLQHAIDVSKKKSLG